jgi:hypothetical protein
VAEDGAPQRPQDGAGRLLQEGSAQPGKAESRLFFQSVQHTTNTVVNFNEGLSFPPPDHIHALEKYAPGFVAAVMQEWHTEMAHRRAFENGHLDLEHEYNMLELRLDHRRIWSFATAIAVLMALIGGSGVALLFMNRVPAGIACLGAYSLSHIPAMLESMRSRKKK